MESFAQITCPSTVTRLKQQPFQFFIPPHSSYCEPDYKLDHKTKVLNIMQLHERDRRDIMERSRGRYKRQQQRLVRSVDNVLISTPPASDVRPFIGHNDIPTTQVRRKRPDQRWAFTDDLESMTGSFGGKMFLRSNSCNNTSIGRHLETQHNSAWSWYWPCRGMPNQAVATYSLLFLRAKLVSSTMTTILSACRVYRRGFFRGLSFAGLDFAMHERLPNFPYYTLPIRCCPYLCFCRPP